MELAVACGTCRPSTGWFYWVPMKTYGTCDLQGALAGMPTGSWRSRRAWRRSWPPQGGRLTPRRCTQSMRATRRRRWRTCCRPTPGGRLCALHTGRCSAILASCDVVVGNRLCLMSQRGHPRHQLAAGLLAQHAHRKQSVAWSCTDLLIGTCFVSPRALAQATI